MSYRFSAIQVHFMPKYFLQVLLLAASYFAAGQASFSLSVSHGIVTLVVFAAEGFALAAAILFGKRMWLGVFLGQLLLALYNGLHWHTALGVSIINSLEAVLGTILFHRLALQSTLAKIRDVSGLFLLIFFILQPFSATLGTTLLWLNNVVPTSQFTIACFSWWCGNALGQALITPLLLTAYTHKNNLRQSLYNFRKLSVFVLATAGILFSTALFSSVTLAFAVTVPLLIFIAEAGGITMVNLATTIVAAVSLLLTQQMHGVFVEKNVILLLDLNGYLLSMALAGQFIAVLLGEYKQAHLEQLEALERLQKIASRVPGMVFQFRLNTDGSTCFPYCSLAIQEIFHLNPEDVLENSEKILAVVHREDYAQLLTSMNYSAKNLFPWLHECRICFDDGSERWLLGNALPERQEDGATVWHGFLTDITERKQMENALKNSESLSTSILNSLTPHIAVLDSTGTIIMVNRAWQRFAQDNGMPDERNYMLGYNYLQASADEGTHANDALSSNEFLVGIKAVMAGQQEEFHIEYPCHSPTENRWFYMTVSQLQGEKSGVVISHENITERKLAEQAMHEAELAATRANRAKSEFLSSMSHELRTPMNAVLGFAQLLELDELSEDQTDSVQHILTAGHHLMDLINEVLDLAKIESDKLQLNLEAVDLGELIQNCLSLVQPLAIKNQVTLIDETCKDCHGAVIADKLRFKQVLLNLISNAIKYNRIGGTVSISCRVINPQLLRINVTDTGKGLSEQQIAKLFQPFERLSAKNSNIEGTGIGLVISKKLIEAMHGTIGVESEVRKGSCFWVEIPII